MQTNFQILFSVRVTHKYFENDVCNCLQFSPKGTTENMLTKHGFKLRKNIDGFDLFSSSDIAGSDLLNYLKATSGRDYFDFDINNTNFNFVFLLNFLLTGYGKWNTTAMTL